MHHDERIQFKPIKTNTHNDIDEQHLFKANFKHAPV